MGRSMDLGNLNLGTFQQHLLNFPTSKEVASDAESNNVSQ